MIRKKIMSMIRCLLQWRIRHIHTKIVLNFVFIIIIPILSVSLISFQFYENSFKNKIGEYSAKLAEQTNTNIDTYMKDIQRISRTPFYNDTVQNILTRIYEEPNYSYKNDTSITEKMNNYLFDLISQKEGISSLFMFGTEGQVLFGYTLTGGYDESLNISQRGWTDLIGQDHTVIIPTHLQNYVSNSDANVFSYIREVKALNTRTTVGYFMINVDTTTIDSILNTVKYPYEGDISVINKKNQQIYSTGMVDADLNEQYRIDMKDGSGIQDLNTEQGNYISAYSTSDFTQFIVIMNTKTMILLKEMYVARRVVIVLLLIFITIALAISVIVSYRIVKPIKGLTQLMQEVENGNFKVRSNIQSDDEFKNLGLGFNSMLEVIDELILKEYKAKLKEREAELLALQNQINPHFLYNTLESITMKAEINDDVEVAKMVSELGKFFRMGLSKKGKAATLSNEVEYVQSYVNIQNIRFQNQIHLHVLIVDPMHLHTLTPQMFLQPLVENAIIHGYERRKRFFEIFISSFVIGSELYIIIRDEGKGMDQEKLNSLRQFINEAPSETLDRKIGLRNVNQRIKLNYGDNFGLEIESALEVGTSIQIRLPYDRGSENEHHVD